MNIEKLANVNFGRIKYEGIFNDKHFGPWNTKPEKYLTPEQIKLSKIVERELSKGPNKNLEIRLGCDKKTDIHFSYDNNDEMSVRLIKRGISIYGDKYYFTPYNKSETNEIKMNFKLNNQLNISAVKQDIRKFIKECREYLTDSFNLTNNGIDEELQTKW